MYRSVSIIHTYIYIYIYIWGDDFYVLCHLLAENNERGNARAEGGQFYFEGGMLRLVDVDTMDRVGRLAWKIYRI